MGGSFSGRGVRICGYLGGSFSAGGGEDIWVGSFSAGGGEDIWVAVLEGGRG